MYLPGTVGERIVDLRSLKGWNQKELATRIELAPSQLSRIESGETKNISGDILVKLAKEFRVSTDYILGLTTVSVPKSYDISELGLSEGAVKGLVTGAVDVEILNRLLEHKSFPWLISLIRIYFQDTAARGIMARNQVIDMATTSISDFMKSNPEHRGEARQDMQFLTAQKIGKHEAEIEKIKNLFLAILRDIKSDMDGGKQPEDTATADMIQKIKAALPDKPQEQITADDVAAAVASQVGQAIAMDEETIGQFRQLMKKIITSKGEYHGNSKSQ